MLTAPSLTRGIAVTAVLVGASLAAACQGQAPAPPPTAEMPATTPTPAPTRPTVIATSAVGAGELARCQLELTNAQTCRATVSFTTREERFDVTLAPLGAVRAPDSAGARPWPGGCSTQVEPSRINTFSSLPIDRS